MEPATSHDSPTPAAQAPLPARRARLLLRKLRDLNLTTARIALAGDRSIRLGGCLSADLPAEESLAYRVRFDETGVEAADGELAIRWREGWLELALHAADGLWNRRLATPLHQDAEGRASVPELGARLDPESARARDVEHFLRRLVRGLLQE